VPIIYYPGFLVKQLPGIFKKKLLIWLEKQR